MVVVDAFPVVVVVGRGSRQPQPQTPTTPTTSTTMSTSSLMMSGGFLEGRIPKNDIRKREDEAMWMGDDDSEGGGGGWNPFQKKKPVEEPVSKTKNKAVTPKTPPQKAVKQASAPPSPKKNAGVFKMPWDK